MILVSDIMTDAKEVFGLCSPEILYQGINDAVEMLSHKGDWSPLMVYLDVCCQGSCATLPAEVETPLAVMVDGVPAQARNQLYRFHLNGPGERGGCDSQVSWEDVGMFPTMFDPLIPTALVAHLERPEDNNTELRVLGYDHNGNWVRQVQPDGSWRDGYVVPTIQGWPIPDDDAPLFSRITAVNKAQTVGRVRLATIDWQPSTGMGLLLGDYLPHETIPSYRRIRLSRCGDWVRLFVRRKTFRVYNLTDFIPLSQRLAVVLAMHAVKAYKDKQIGDALGFETHAARLLTEREDTISPPAASPIQVVMQGSLYNPQTDDFGND